MLLNLTAWTEGLIDRLQGHQSRSVLTMTNQRLLGEEMALCFVASWMEKASANDEAMKIKIVLLSSSPESHSSPLLASCYP